MASLITEHTGSDHRFCERGEKKSREKDWWFALLITNTTLSGKMKYHAQELPTRSPQMHMSKDMCGIPVVAQQK